MYTQSLTSVKSEYIKVKNDGLFFHELKFMSLRDLISWFKKNHKTSDYKRYARKTKAPLIDKKPNVMPSINRGNYSRDVKCHHCQGNHLKRDCPTYTN